MLFDVWGSDTLIHWVGWAMVFIGLIVLNEVGRRTKLGAAIIFGVAPLAMTIYCVAIAIGVSQGAEWALTNPTHVYQNSWFHYAKVYAALAIWCMFAQVFPYFQEESIFVTHSTLDPAAATAVSIAALIANVAAIIYIAYRAKKLGRNPYKQDVFEGTSDWEKATARRAKVDYAHAE